MCLFIVAVWSPAGKGLNSWLSFLMSNCEFITFPLISWVRYLIVSIPDLCHIYYFKIDASLQKLSIGNQNCYNKDNNAGDSEDMILMC